MPFPHRPVHTLSIAAIVVALSACASGEPPPFHTTPGPESPAVLDGVVGHIAVAHQGDDEPCNPVRAIGPSSDIACAPYPRAGRGNGEVGIVPESAHTLLMMQMLPDEGTVGTHVSLVRRRCARPRFVCIPDEERLATWTVARKGGLYGKTVAVSPDGRRAAVLPVSYFMRMDGYAPPAPLGYHVQDQRNVGELVLVDLHDGATHASGIAIVDEQPISWSGDGRRLLFVRAETIDRLPARLIGELHGSEGKRDGAVPVIESWDVATGAIEMLAIGYRPLWTADQRQLLFTPDGDRYVLRDLQTHDDRAVALPGIVGRFGAIAMVAPGKVLYWALPTEGTAASSTGHNSPLIGPKQMVSLKVADLDTQAFATVYRRIDPRANVGFTSRY